LDDFIVRRGISAAGELVFALLDFHAIRFIEAIFRSSLALIVQNGRSIFYLCFMPAAEFFDYYGNLFGERWPSLLEALHGEAVYKTIQYEGGEEPYYLDEASVFAAKSLDVHSGMNVLDMCAAPGGKSLVIAGALAGEGSLQCNDRSPDRRLRLSRVVENCLPEKFRSIIKVTGYDGAKFGMCRREEFDRILLDAPCSSERHVLEGEKYLAEWSPKRISHLAITQGSLLASAIDSLKFGGKMIYSTCALSSAENDDVVRKILKKRAGKFRVLKLNPGIEGTDATEFGLHILPDRCGGRGPIFCALLEKI